jgi:hypothetical protein
MIQPDVDEASQESPCREDHALGKKLLMKPGFHPMNPTVPNQQPIHHVLANVQVGLRFHNLFHPLAIKLHVVLGSGPLDGESFAGVEAPELDGRGIGVPGHLTAQSVDLFDQVPFGQPADSGVAAHSGDVVEIDGEQKSGVTHAGRSQGGFTPCMTCTDHNDVIVFVEDRHSMKTVHGARRTVQEKKVHGARDTVQEKPTRNFVFSFLDSCFRGSDLVPCTLSRAPCTGVRDSHA